MFAFTQWQAWVHPSFNTVEMHTADVWSGQGHMEAKTVNKVISSSPSAAWTGLTPARTSTNSEMQQLAHILSSEDHQTFYEDCSFPPLLLFMFINGLLTVRMVYQQWLAVNLLINSSCRLQVCPLHQVALTSRSACEAKLTWKESHCFPPLMLLTWIWGCTW